MAEDEEEPPDDRFAFGGDSLTPEATDEDADPHTPEATDEDADPGASADGTPAEGPTDAGRPEGADDEGPLGDLAREVSDRRSGGTESGDLFEEAFTEMETEDVDVEEVWEDLEDGAVSRERRDTGEEPEVRVQDKHVCHGCEYFSEPPEMYCNHEGTEIREVVSVEQVEPPATKDADPH